MSDPFDALSGDDAPVAPRADFAAALRRRLVVLLADPVPTDPPAPTPAPVPPSRSTPMTATTLTPYLTVHDGSAALAFYAAAFGAIETSRFVMDDGRIGHAEVRIGEVLVYLSDEFPEIGVVSPRTLGGTTSALHLQVGAVDDAYARAVAAGAVAQTEPADQPHGARHGTLLDPFGHRWMLSQPLEAPAPRATRGGIWSAVNYVDALAGIDFLVEVFGFERRLVVPGAGPGVVDHSELVWPEGGVVQAATADRPDNVYATRATVNLYVITADPLAVWARCVAAGVEVVRPPSSPHYDPDGTVFSVRDPEGHIWSFGSYAGEG